jgi:hypothetical protein
MEEDKFNVYTFRQNDSGWKKSLTMHVNIIKLLYLFGKNLNADGSVEREKWIEKYMETEDKLSLAKCI